MTEREDAQLCAEEVDESVEEPVTDLGEEPAIEISRPEIALPEIPQQRGTCQTRLRGWAGAHVHGAVRPRRRAAGRGRPPRRWC